MKLGNLLKAVSYLEMKDLYAGGSGKGVIPKAAREKLIMYVNEGLRNIYLEFPLSMQEVVIRLKENINIYTLDKEHALSNKDSSIPESLRYIEDTPLYPFEDNIIRIEQVANIDGVMQDVNMLHSIASIRITGYNKIQVPFTFPNERLVVTYQGYHKEIPYCACDNYDIDIPPMFEEMLRAYISYAAYSGMNVSSAAQKAGEFYAKYQMLVSKMAEKNVLNQHNSGYNARFALGGFV